MNRRVAGVLMVVAGFVPAYAAWFVAIITAAQGDSLVATIVACGLLGAGALISWVVGGWLLVTGWSAET